MEGILEDEPLISPPRNGVNNYDFYYDEIRRKAIETKASTRNTVVSRARLVKENENTEKAFQELWSKVREKKKEEKPPEPEEEEDLRQVINRVKAKQKKTWNSDHESFYSMSSNSNFSSRITTTSYCRDLVHSLGKKDLKDEQRTNILDIISNLPIKGNVRLAESLVCVPNDGKYDIFNVCSLLLEEEKCEENLTKYLQFFGRVLKTVFTQENITEKLKRLMQSRGQSFNLYEKLLEILMNDQDHSDRVFRNSVAKAFYFLTSEHKIEELAGQNFNLRKLVAKLHEEKNKYPQYSAFIVLRFWYKLRHEMNMNINDSPQEVKYCNWLTDQLKREPGQIDCLYALYFILNRMEMTTLLQIFKTFDLEKLLSRCIEAHQKEMRNNEELLAVKIKTFCVHGNFQSGKSQRDALMESKLGQQGQKKLKNNFRPRNGHDPDLIPLDDHPPQKAYYKGILKSITDLNETPQPYEQTDEVHTDRRQEMIQEEESKINPFTYGRILNLSKFADKGFNLKCLPNADAKYIVASDICDLLNAGKPGLMLIGVAGEEETEKIVRGVKMDRKDRDEFRVGFDNLLANLIVPQADFSRFGIPVFNPVLQHPKEDLNEECCHFVVRLEVKVWREEVFYKVKRPNIGKSKKSCD